MGKSSSKHAELTDTGVVNSNFIVEQESVAIPTDVRVVLYVLTVAILILLLIKMHKAYRKGMRKDFSRTMVLRTHPALGSAGDNETSRIDLSV